MTYSILAQQNVSYSLRAAVRKSQSTISGTLAQAMGSTSEEESATNCSDFGPAYETVDPSLRGGRDDRNKCPSLNTDAGIPTEETAFSRARHRSRRLLTCNARTTEHWITS